MNLLDAAETPLYFTPNEVVSKVVAQMANERKDEAVVIDAGKFFGVVYSGELIKKTVDTPHKTEIRKFCSKVSPISPTKPIDAVLESVIKNNYKSMPIEAGSKTLMLTKIGMLKFFSEEPVLNKEDATSVMKFPQCITPEETISTCMSMFRELGVSRFPVVNESGMVEGIVETIDVLRSYIDVQKVSVGDESGEKIHKRAAMISSLMRKPPLTVSPATSLREIADRMIASKSQTVIVADKGRIAGIITPKLIIQLIKARVFDKKNLMKGIHVEVSGIQKEDSFVQKIVDEEITSEVKKLAKLFRINRLVLHVEKHQKTDAKIRYDVHGRLITNHGYFFADFSDWDLSKAVKSILDKLEREVIKSKEKYTTYKAQEEV